MCCKQACLSHWYNVYVTSKTRKRKIEQSIHDRYKGSNICEGLFRYMMGFKVTSKDFVNEM